MARSRFIPFVLVVFSSFLVVERSTEASITSTAFATHTLKIESITGPANLVTIEAVLYDLSASTVGEGETSATASVKATVAGETRNLNEGD